MACKMGAYVVTKLSLPTHSLPFSLIGNMASMDIDGPVLVIPDNFDAELRRPSRLM